MSEWDNWCASALATIEDKNQRRARLPLTPVDAVNVLVDGRPVTLFSGNDYLGLSAHPKVREAAAAATAQFGMGPRGSALICGYTDAHEALERDLATLKGTESALVTPTGFAANTSAIATLGDESTALFSDTLNHASLIDGCHMAKRMGATVTRYRHGDAEHLESLLSACKRPRRVILTDSLFSMDGDLAPLQDLAALRDMYDALLVVDEAHGTLVFGQNGGGVAEHFGVADRVDLHIGTLSKAIGAMGGFIACSQQWRDLILNKGRAQIFSTALPLPVVVAARTAIKVAKDEPALRQRLWKHVDRVAQMQNLPATSPIFSLIIGDEKSTMTESARLMQAGLHVTAIRPPTVPVGTSRLRLTLSAAHTSKDVVRLTQALA
jgi:8-amino-7-oxononanoate synthase